MLKEITITGLHSQPKTFKYGTIVRILMKRGAKYQDIYRIERELAEEGSSEFKQFKLRKPNGKVLSVGKNASRRESWPNPPLLI